MLPLQPLYLMQVWRHKFPAKDNEVVVVKQYIYIWKGDRDSESNICVGERTLVKSRAMLHRPNPDGIYINFPTCLPFCTQPHIISMLTFLTVPVILSLKKNQKNQKTQCTHTKPNLYACIKKQLKRIKIL